MKKKLIALFSGLFIGACGLGLSSCTPPHEHDFTDVVTAPTCTEQGYTTHTCACGETKIDTRVGALGHDFTTYVSNGDAMCEEDGTETATCSRTGCQETDTRVDEDSALGHDFTTYASNGDATCEEDGTETATCARTGCQETDTRTDEDSALGHDFTDYISDNNATYTADGTKTATCNRDDCEETDTIADVGSMLEGKIEFTTLTVEGTTVTGTLDGAVEEFDFNEEITVFGNVAYIVAKDVYGQDDFPIKKAPLAVGENVFYVIVTKEGQEVKTYTVTLIRQGSVINFDVNGGTGTFEPMVASRGKAFALPTNEPTRAGYDFDGWTYAGTEIVDGTVWQMEELTVTLTARWQAIYTLNGSTLTGLTEYGKALTKLTVPSAIDGQTITTIGAEAFMDNTHLTELTLPNTIVTIDDGAIQSCTGLTYFVVPDSVTTIGEYAFAGCTGVTYAVGGKGLVWNNVHYTFMSGCNNLTKFYYSGTLPLGDTYNGMAIYYYVDSEPELKDQNYWSYDAHGEIIAWEKEILPDNVIHVAYAKAGYGSAFMEQWAAEFEALYPEYEVELEGEPTMTAEVETRLVTGSNVPDVFIVLETGWQKLALQGLLEPLDDVYDAYAYDDVTIEEFLNPGIRDYGKMPDGSYYTIPWSDGATGIIYNYDMFEQYGWEVPTTVEELMTLCAQITTDTDGEIKPFAFLPSYAGYVVDTWWAQYEGATNYEKFFDYERPEMYVQQGRVEALRAFENLFYDAEDWRQKNSVFGIYSHTDAQTAFAQGHAAMIIEGAWLETEASTTLGDSIDYRMMPTPYISGACKDADGNYKPILASQAGDFMCIPKDSNTKEGAKLFLQYINSKAGCESYTKATGGALRPFQYKASEVEGVTASAFMQSCWDIYENSTLVYSYSNNPMSWTNKLGKWPGVGQPYWSILLGLYYDYMDTGESGEYVSDQATFVCQSCYDHVCGEWDNIMAEWQ